MFEIRLWEIKNSELFEVMQTELFEMEGKVGRSREFGKGKEETLEERKIIYCLRGIHLTCKDQDLHRMVFILIIHKSRLSYQLLRE